MNLMDNCRCIFGLCSGGGKSENEEVINNLNQKESSGKDSLEYYKKQNQPKLINRESSIESNKKGTITKE